jgi:hypothetical protein
MAGQGGYFVVRCRNDNTLRFFLNRIMYDPENTPPIEFVTGRNVSYETAAEVFHQIMANNILTGRTDKFRNVPV